jgi:hypothetical protein
MRVFGLDLVCPCFDDVTNGEGRMDVIRNWCYSLIHYIVILNYVDWSINSVSQVLPGEIVSNDRCPILSTVHPR